ncbi:MAG: hypothetical protein ABIW84_07465 [Ilumatobacteraceae bacterium]
MRSKFVVYDEALERIAAHEPIGGFCADPDLRQPALHRPCRPQRRRKAVSAVKKGDRFVAPHPDPDRGCSIDTMRTNLVQQALDDLKEAT